MAITGFGNVAIKVSDMDQALAFFSGLGAPVSDRGSWGAGERADVALGTVTLTLFTEALYEDRLELPGDSFLHLAVFTDDLDRALAGQDVLWGPNTISGVFGTRRVAFVAAPGDTRLELMEQVEAP